MEIAGKKAVICGGASGMAKATAQMLHQKGADVAILDLPKSAGDRVPVEVGEEAVHQQGPAEAQQPGFRPTSWDLSRRHQDPRQADVDVRVAPTSVRPIDHEDTLRTSHDVERVQVQVEDP